MLPLRKNEDLWTELLFDPASGMFWRGNYLNLHDYKVDESQNTLLYMYMDNGRLLSRCGTVA